MYKDKDTLQRVKQHIDLGVVDFAGFFVQGSSLFHGAKPCDSKILSCFRHSLGPFCNAAVLEVLASRCVSLLRDDFSLFVLH